MAKRLVGLLIWPYPDKLVVDYIRKENGNIHNKTEIRTRKIYDYLDNDIYKKIEFLGWLFGEITKRNIKGNIVRLLNEKNKKKD